jgi:hypothetical protein
MYGVDIVIDLSELNLSASMAPFVNVAVQSAINTSLLVIRDRWQQEAQQRLQSTRTDYLLGLSFDSIKYPYENNPFCGAVVLQGKVANALEKGWSPFDMKIGFSKSFKKITTSGGGWYLTIPMRHSTPGAFMYGRAMPPDIYIEAKKLPNWGNIKVSGGQLTSWTGYQHKNNIYDRLTKIQKDYGKTKQSQYYTFRRVSNHSDPLSWWHPGFGGVNIAQGLESFSETIFKRTLDANLRQVLGGK